MTDERSPWHRRGAIAVGILLIAIALWPALAAARASLRLPWNPSGDWALLAMWVEDVGHVTPLLGPYSRFGWNHPGPLMFWMLAVPYHLAGGAAEALLASTAWVNALALGGSVGVAWRRGRLPLAASTTVALMILTRAIGPEQLRDPWNPYITMLPLALFVFLVWSGVEGDRWAWPLAVLVGSFIVQSHVGYLVIVAVIVLAAAVLLWLDRREIPLLPIDPRRRRLLIATTVGATVFCWLPVLVDQFAGSGNLTAIASYFLHSGDQPAGVHDALAQAAGQLPVPDAAWLGTAASYGPDGALQGGALMALVVPVLVFAATVAFAALRRQRSALRFQLLTTAGVVGGLIATSRITGPVFSYLVRWWVVLACLWWLSAVWSLYRSLLSFERLPELVRRHAPTIVVALGLVAGFTIARPVAHAAPTTPPPEASNSELLAGLLPPLVDALRGEGPARVETVGSTWGTMADGVRFGLTHAGIPVVVDPEFAYKFGQFRSDDLAEPNANVWVVHGDAVRIWRNLPNVTLVSSWDPLASDARELYAADEALLQTQLIAAGADDLAAALSSGGGGVDSGSVGLPGVDQDLVRRVEQVRRKGDPIAIFITPAHA